MTKIKRIFCFTFQYFLYYLVTPLACLLYKNKYPWIICERGNDARDNGYTMFKYLRGEQQYINAYYLINKKSVDYPKVKSLGKVVRYKSFKHWLLYRVAECRMSTHLAAFAPGNYIGEWFKHHKQKGINVFLQHGITHNEFPSNYFEHNGSDLFICGAKPEYEHISNNCHYPSGNVVYTGFSRFDELHNFEAKNQILVMPSWRNYLQNLSKEEFKQSKYFNAYNNLLRNKELNERLEKEGIQLIFYIHYSLQQYSKYFTGYGPNIIIADFDQFDVQTLLKESKLLVTDYSSIFFDFAYMKKPVIYYQFDVDDFYSKHYQRSFFNHKNDGFGPITNNENQTAKKILDSLVNNFIMDGIYLKKVEKFFPLYNTHNSERIFNSIIDKYISSKTIIKESGTPTYLMFTGDDYGRNKESTKGINEAFKKGYIQQASLMVNRSDEDLCYINEMPKKRVIYHFNITEGYQSFGDTSFYAYSVNKDSLAKRINTRKSFFRINNDDLSIIKEELNNQISKYKSFGYECFAFDSHGHMHNRLPLAKVLIPKCYDEGFRVARLPTNINNHHPLFDLTYKKYVTHLYRKKFITSDYFCSCYDLIHMNLNKYKGKIIELMTHPFICEYGLVNRRDISFEIVQKHLSKYNVKLIYYIDLIKMKENNNG